MAQRSKHNNCANTNLGVLPISINIEFRGLGPCILYNVVEESVLWGDQAPPSSRHPRPSNTEQIILLHFWNNLCWCLIFFQNRGINIFWPPPPHSYPGRRWLFCLNWRTGKEFEEELHKKGREKGGKEGKRKERGIKKKGKIRGKLGMKKKIQGKISLFPSL